MSITPNLSIVIVTFNSEKYISNCLLKLLLSLSKLKIKTSIVVVDNNSSDNTVLKIRADFFNIINKQLFIIENRKNKGFAHAINQGIKLFSSDNYLLLNPDVEVNLSTMSNILRCQTKHHAGIVGVKTVDSNSVHSGSYFRFPNLQVALFDFTNLRKLSVTDKWHKYFYYTDKNQKTGDFKVDMVTGGFMLIKNDVIKRIGLLDTRFFMYLEDIDYCLQASREGFETWVCGDEIVTHVGGASSNNKDRIRHTSWLSSRKKYFLKNFGFFENLIVQLAFFADDILVTIGKLKSK